jgi:HlyD family secretion protein
MSNAVEGPSGAGEETARTEVVTTVKSRTKVSGTVWVLLGVLALSIGAVLAAMFSFSSRPAQAVTSSAPLAVACLGRLEPEYGVIEVAAPYFDARPSVVAELRVEEGDWVHAGQVLAVLDGKDTREAEVKSAEAHVAMAQARLAQVKAGEKAGEIAAQEADVARSEATLANAETEFRRYQELFKEGVASAEQFDERRMRYETAHEILEWSRQKLKAVAEVRATDIHAAEAEVAAAIVDVKRSRAEAELTVMRAPIEGRVLKIHVRPGEQADKTVLDLGRTDRMYANAEVYETDVGKIRMGQRATVSSVLFPGELHGSVVEIGREITKNEILPLDPAAFADSRIVKVKVRLDDSGPVAGLIHGKVTLRFAP